jgi:glycerol-1-phosphate dehydrogenase [NAD(P)+]
MIKNNVTNQDSSLSKIPNQVQDYNVGEASSNKLDHLELVSRSIYISYNLASQAEKLISNLGFKNKRILFVTDEKIWKNCARFFDASFLKKILILKSPKPDEKNLKKIAIAAKNCDLILALGSGTINDLCKFTSAKTKIPYAIFASAASMNGYLSKNASITILGHKKTLSATLPIAVFCDLKILKKSPLRLTKAGIGDSLCFYSCWFDWYLSHKILGTKFDQKPFEILREKMEFLVKNFHKFSIRDEDFLKILIEILLLSGQGMTIAGGSYPASQSEHLIAHAIEMKYPKLAQKNLHGAMIAATSLTAAKLQKYLLDNHQFCHPELVSGSIQSKLQKFFGKKIAAECKKEYEQKLLAIQQIKKLNGKKLNGKNPNWKKIKTELQKIHFDESRLKEIFSHFKIKTSPKSLGLSSQQYQECVTYAKFIRNRFTCLDFIKSEDDDGSIEETLHLLSSIKNRKHLLSAIKNEDKRKSITFKSKTEMKKFFAKL